MSDDQKTPDFRAGYEAAKKDAIERSLMERVAKSEPGWREHNVAIGLAVIAIRDLDVRHSVPALPESTPAAWERGYVEGVAAGRRDMTRDVLLSAATMTREMLIVWLEASLKGTAHG